MFLLEMLIFQPKKLYNFVLYCQRHTRLQLLYLNLLPAGLSENTLVQMSVPTQVKRF